MLNILQSFANYAIQKGNPFTNGGQLRTAGERGVVGSFHKSRFDRKQQHSKPIHQCFLHADMGRRCLHESIL